MTAADHTIMHNQPTAVPTTTRRPDRTSRSATPQPCGANLPGRWHRRPIRDWPQSQARRWPARHSSLAHAGLGPKSAETRCDKPMPVRSRMNCLHRPRSSAKGYGGDEEVAETDGTAIQVDGCERQPGGGLRDLALAHTPVPRLLPLRMARTAEAGPHPLVFQDRDHDVEPLGHGRCSVLAILRAKPSAFMDRRGWTTEDRPSEGGVRRGRPLWRT